MKNWSDRWSQVWRPALRRWVLATLSVLALLHMASLSSHSTEVVGESSFAKPQAAVNAVVAACKKNDTAALLTLFGPDGKDIVESGDPSDDHDNRARFVAAVAQRNKLIADPKNPDKMILSIGKDDWPFPIPLMRHNGRWSFDSAQGRNEILARRIGSNEMNADEVCRAYVEAQFEYAQTHKQNGVPVYAHKIISDPGKQDGLYWEPAAGQAECPVPKGFARAAAGMSLEKGEPYRGYYFRILTAQGPDARGGAMSYLVNGSMIGGFALVAWPAEYGVSGVQTYIVNHDGVVYENQLGPETVRVAAEMTDYNPDKSWKPVQ